MSHLVVRAATVRFPRGHLALAGVDLEVAAGEVVAVLGPSGSGKSTLLRAVAGLQPLDGGSVHLAGRDLAGVPPHRRNVGLMFQDHALFPHRDVAANVGFGLRMQRHPPEVVRARVEELLELVDLPGFGPRRVQTLSGGEQQRVALARALAPEPDVLLLDEPLGALDRGLRDRLVTELRSLFARLELTVVAVTHDQAEAFTLADRIVVVDEGQVLQTGAPRQLWARPASRRVAELLGFDNLLAVDVEAGRADTPWGPVSVAATADGPAVVLVPPTEVRLRRDGDGSGAPAVVRSVAFQGDRSLVQVAGHGGAALECVVDSAAAPAVGELVTVDLSAARVVVLPVDGSPMREGGARPPYDRGPSARPDPPELP